MTRGLLLRIGALAMVVTTTACGAGPSSSAPGEGPILVPEQEAYPASLLEGRLRVESTCFVVGDAVLLLPEGTTWDPEIEELTIDGTAVTVGDPVSLGGGDVPVSVVEELAGSSEQEAAERCLENGAGDDLFLVSGM